MSWIFRYASSVRSTLLRLLILSVAAYGALCLLVFIFQRRMMYFPTRQSADAALQAARRMGLEPWKDEGGRILGWRSPHPSRRAEGTMLVAHGNAGSALDRTYLRDAFQDPGIPKALDIILLEYPGYGPREGSPSEASLVDAAVEAIDRIRTESGRPILLLGESLGSAVISLAVAKHPDQAKGLLLVTPLKNAPAVARRHYYFVPSFLLRDTFQADQSHKKQMIPACFLIAGQDEVVFPDLGQQLYEAYEGPKRLWMEESAGHNSLDFHAQNPRWAEMIDFLMGE